MHQLLSWSIAITNWDKKRTYPWPIQLFSRTRPQFSRSGTWPRLRASSYADHIDQKYFTATDSEMKLSQLNWIWIEIHHQRIARLSRKNAEHKIKWPWYEEAWELKRTIKLKIKEILYLKLRNSLFEIKKVLNRCNAIFKRVLNLLAHSLAIKTNF